MKQRKVITLSLLLIVFCIAFSSCSSDTEDKEEKVMSEHITDMQSFSWKRLELVNGKYMFLASYADNEDYRNIKSANVVFFTFPVIDCSSPVGKYTITSASFLARKDGAKWFEFGNDYDCGTIEITKGTQGYNVSLAITELSDRNSEYVKNLKLTYSGKIINSSMLEY